MDKSTFLKEISSLSREEIQKKLLQGSVRKKKIEPIIYIKPKTNKDGDKDDKRN